MKKIGLIGLDTSHVTAFADILNNEDNPHYIGGARVTVAWPGGSPDFPASIDRVKGFTNALRDDYGVEILDSPEAVAEACDILFIESVDGRVHLDQFKRTIKYKRPTFIDKPVALKTAEVREIVRLAEEAGVGLMGGSSLRYAEGLAKSLAEGRDDVQGCNIYGPMAEQSTQPGLFWYGCHAIEMMVAAMGAGCAEVRCVRTDKSDILTAVWEDGRMASYQGLREAHSKFGIVLHRVGGAELINASEGRPYYVGLIESLMANLPENRSGIDHRELVEVVAIMEAGNISRAKDGAPVKLADI